MKKRIFWGVGLLLLFLLGCGIADLPDKKGPVVELKTVKWLMVSWEDADGEVTRVREVEYDRQGRKTEERHYMGDRGSQLDRRTKYRYDDQGRDWKHIDYHGDGTINFITEFVFDERDSISGYRSYDELEQLTFQVKSGFDAQGRCVADTAMDVSGELRFRDVYELDGSGKRLLWDRFNGEGLDHRVEYKYNEAGQLVEMVCSGSLGGTYKYEYNAKGRKSKEHAWNTDDQLFLWTKVWVYDTTGRILEVLKYVEEGKEDQPEKVYDYDYEFWD